MCNLYDIGRPRSKANSEWEQAIVSALDKAESPLKKRNGIRKTDPGLVLRIESTAITPEVMRWGFHRAFNPSINNARSDKLDGMWADSWQAKRRCLIPIETFYEWSGAPGQKQTFAFQSVDKNAHLWAAGIWEPCQENEKTTATYSMLTTDSSNQVSEIHHRMPVLLEETQFERFLNDDDPRDLLRPFTGDLEIFRCRNPLKNPADHSGPEREDFLPGFE